MPFFSSFIVQESWTKWGRRSIQDISYETTKSTFTPSLAIHFHSVLHMERHKLFIWQSYTVHVYKMSWYIQRNEQREKKYTLMTWKGRKNNNWMRAKCTNVCTERTSMYTHYTHIHTTLVSLFVCVHWIEKLKSSFNGFCMAWHIHVPVHRCCRHSRRRRHCCFYWFKM